MDMIKTTVPMFIRLMELSREEIKDDAEIHVIAELMATLTDGASMGHYQQIMAYLERYRNSVKK